MREIIYERGNLPRGFEIRRDRDRLKVVLGKDFDLKSRFNQERLAREMGERLGKRIDYRDQNTRRMFEDHARGLESGRNRFDIRSDFLDLN